MNGLLSALHCLRDPPRTWSRHHRPAFARRVNLRTYLGEREPSVRMTDGRASLVYVATDAEGKVAGLAVATNGP